MEDFPYPLAAFYVITMTARRILPVIAGIGFASGIRVGGGHVTDVGEIGIGAN